MSLSQVEKQLKSLVERTPDPAEAIKYQFFFEPDPEQSWPTGLDIPENLTSIAGGSSSRVNIQVKNVTDHKIVFPGRTALGHLQQVKSVTPKEVKKKNKKSP